MAASPYEGLEPRAYWRTAVATRGPGRIRDLYDPRFRIARDTRVFTAGSCFAQHVHRALAEAGFSVVEREPAPASVPEAVSERFFYGSFSARFGNIYTSRQFRQLIEEAAGSHKPAYPVWEREGRYYDALRPNVDPGGYATAAAVLTARQDHLGAVAEALTAAEVVVFTLGLTETWEDKATGTVYPTAPGVIADAPDGADIGFLNLGHDQIVADLRMILAHLRALRPDVKLLLTVSPVPLTATATGGHVLVASTASKAILRAAVATLMAEDEGVDYFPSYEIITNPAARGNFFAANLRSPSPTGVRIVMEHFLRAQDADVDPATSRNVAERVEIQGDAEDFDAICEEVLNDPSLSRKEGV